MKTFLKRLSGILLLLAGFLLIFHGIENWRGARALARWEATTKALGQPLTLEELAPPPIPDAENFAQHPGVADAIAGRPQPEGADPAGSALEWRVIPSLGGGPGRGPGGPQGPAKGGRPE